MFNAAITSSASNMNGPVRMDVTPLQLLYDSAELIVVVCPSYAQTGILGVLGASETSSKTWIRRSKAAHI
jgi:hypothetical protein